MQEQFTGSENLIDLIKNNSLADVFPKFEIILKGRRKGEKHYYEVLADQQGKILEVAEIIERPIDNLEF